MSFLKKLFIPHHTNQYHPYSTRHYTLIGFSILLLILNFVVFPSLGIKTGTVLASNIDTTELISLANKERKSVGLGDLQYNEELTRAALAKGQDMLKKQYWSHFGPNGETPWQFIISSGYNYVYAGENLAKDFSTSFDAHLAWMNSPTHRANILNANYRDVGISVVTGNLNGKETTIIIQMFGSRIAGTNTSTQNTQPSQNTKAIEPTPTPTPDIRTYTPKITSPRDNSIFNSTSITLQGEAEIGDTIKVFSNGKLIGELPKDGNPFTVNVDLLEFQNKIDIQTKRKTDSAVSLNSNEVNVTIDNTPPDLDKVYINYYDIKEGKLIEITSEEELANIDIQIDYELNNLTKDKSSFYYLLQDKNLTKITLIFYDQAGNTSTKDYDLNQIERSNKTLPIIAGLTSSSSQSFFQKLNFKLGERELVNISIISLVLGLILLDASVLFKNGIKREWSAHQGFHFALILICIVGVMTI